jgi:hypothetical protein
MRPTRIAIGLFVTLLALTSCGDTTPQEPLPPEQPPSPAVLVLEAVTPLSATGVVGEELGVAPVVLVRGDGRPMEGIRVTFEVSGNGLVGNAAVMTDAAGRATPGTWRLGPGAGPQTLTARVVALTLQFTTDAQPGPIASLAVVGGNSQWAAVGAPLPAPLRVKATDRFGNVLAGAAVAFEVVDGGGSVAPAASLTGSDGTAQSSWTLGTTAGRQHVRAQTGAANAQFAADACQPACSAELAYMLNGDIVIFNSATRATRQLTTDGQSLDPAWSPDGKRIAFARYSRGEDGPTPTAIFVMNSDGTGLIQVTGPGFRSPSWSPQGDALAFDGSDDSSCTLFFCGAIYVQELSVGSVMRRVATSGFAPAWSPDGSRIAFVGHSMIDDDDHYSLRLVNPDGSGLQEIAQAGWVYSDRPTWSPDGILIAFSLWGHIHVIRADGTGQTQLTTSQSALPRGLAWSPDGVRIAYEYGGTIMEISVHGGEPTPLTFGYSPSWRP